MTEKERMENGLLYDPGDPEILAEQYRFADLLREFNLTRSSETEKRACLLRAMFADVGENCCIEPPFYANWSGQHMHFGCGVYANFHLTVVDDGEVYVGDHVMFGPNVTIATAAHPVLPSLRERGIQYNIPVRIGANVWIGAGVIVLPGVTIGDNSVIGAGSIVTRDIPADVVAVGNPCRVMRPIGEKDREFYYKDRRIDVE